MSPFRTSGNVCPGFTTMLDHSLVWFSSGAIPSKILDAYMAAERWTQLLFQGVVGVQPEYHLLCKFSHRQPLSKLFWLSEVSVLPAGNQCKQSTIWIARKNTRTFQSFRGQNSQWSLDGSDLNQLKRKLGQCEGGLGTRSWAIMGWLQGTYLWGAKPSILFVINPVISNWSITVRRCETIIHLHIDSICNQPCNYELINGMN